MSSIKIYSDLAKNRYAKAKAASAHLSDKERICELHKLNIREALKLYVLTSAEDSYEGDVFKINPTPFEYAVSYLDHDNLKDMLVEQGLVLKHFEDYTYYYGLKD